MVVMRAQVGAGGVHHHRRVDAVEGALLDHEDLAAAALLGRGAQDHDPPAELVGEGRGGEPGAEPGGGDDVVAAGVADAREGVVLAEDGDGRAPRSRPGPRRRCRARRPAARRLRPASSSTPVSRSWAWCSSKPSSGWAWMSVGDVDQQVGPTVDLVAHPVLQLGGLHAATIPARAAAALDARPCWRLTPPRVSASGCTETSRCGRATDVHAVEADVERRREVEAHGSAPDGAQGRVREVGARPGPASGHPSIPESEVAVGDVEESVVGMRAWSQVPVPQPLGVHDGHGPAAPPGPAGDEMGDEAGRTSRRWWRGRGRSGRSSPPRSGGGPRRPDRRACGTGRRRAGRPSAAGGPPGALPARRLEPPHRSAPRPRPAGAERDGPTPHPCDGHVAGSGPAPGVSPVRWSPWCTSTGGAGVVAMADEAATTPRCTASTAALAVSAVPGAMAVSASWRSRSSSWRIVRTKSPPERLVAQQMVEIVSRGPRVGQADEPPVGRAGLGKSQSRARRRRWRGPARPAVPRPTRPPARGTRVRGRGRSCAPRR